MKTNKLWYFLLAILVLTTTACSNDDDDEVLVGNWTIKSSFRGSPRRGASSFVINNNAYVCLGYKDGGNRLSDLWVYDASKDSWTQKADLPVAQGAMPRSSAVGFAAGTKGYITTGYGGPNPSSLVYLKDTWEYDPGTDTWAKKADFGGSARSSAIAAGLNGKGYVGTGYNPDEGQMVDFWEYNPTDNTWTEKANVRGNKRQGALSFIVNNTIYVCLGTSNGQYLTDLEAYNVSTDTWTRKRDMWNATDESFDDKYNMQRAYGSTFVIDGKAYICLGDTNGQMRGDTWEYDPNADTWVQKTAFEGTLRTDAVGFSVNNRGFVCTGVTGTTMLDDVYEFKPNEEKNDNDNRP